MPKVLSAPAPSLHWFQLFACELLEAKREVLQATEAEAPSANSGARAKTAVNGTSQTETETASLTVTATAELEPVLGRPQVIWNRLALLLDQQLMEASRMAGPVGLEFHREAVYVMATLADEMFLHLEWEGIDFWLGHLLEARFFQTHLAGEQLFRRIDQLMMRDDQAAGEMAGVYLSALVLGFRGRYRGPAHDNVIDSYRKRLFFFIARRDPELTSRQDKLFPQAYENTLVGATAARMPSARRWLLASVGALVCWLILAQVLWVNVSAELRHRVSCLTPHSNDGCVVPTTGKGK